MFAPVELPAVNYLEPHLPAIPFDEILIEGGMVTRDEAVWLLKIGFKMNWSRVPWIYRPVRRYPLPAPPGVKGLVERGYAHEPFMNSVALTLQGITVAKLLFGEYL